MKYVIMCGGQYNFWETPRQLLNIGGERVVDRTIRLLRKFGVDDICITSNNPAFDSCGVPRLTHPNSYVSEQEGKNSGYWLDAFYPDFTDKEVCFIFGDVYFTENAIKTIVNYKASTDTLFGTGIARNALHKNWGEPFAYKVVDYPHFMEAVREVKELQDKGKLKRVALVWELYRYLNGLDVNVQSVKDDTYIVIDDITMDMDSPDAAAKMKSKIEGTL